MIDELDSRTIKGLSIPLQFFPASLYHRLQIIIGVIVIAIIIITMKSSIVLLGGALCLVQAGYHIQYSDQILLPRAVGKARQASKRLALQPAIQKKKLGGGPLKEETGSDKGQYSL